MSGVVKKYRCELLVILALYIPLAFGNEFTNYEATLLVTSASLEKFNEGKVIGYFPKAAISLDRVRPSKGYFLFDTDPEKINSYQLPVTITKSRATKKYNAETKKFEELTQAENKVGLASEALLSKLLQLVNSTKVEVSQGVVPLGTLDDLLGFTPQNPKSWYLLKSDSAKESMDMLSVDPMGRHSVRLELGDRHFYQDLYQKISAQDASGGANVYRRHFSVLPLEIRIFKLIPGNSTGNPYVVRGLNLVKHRDARITKGAFILEREKENSKIINVDSIKAEDEETFTFSVEASRVLNEVITPFVRGASAKEDFQLECVLPEDEGDSDWDFSCQKKEGKVVFSGRIGLSQEKPLVAIVERALRQNENPDDYRDQFRVEFWPAEVK